MILSDNDFYLRRVARDRFGYSYLSTILPYDIEFALSKIFERELDCIKNVESMLSYLRLKEDYNVNDVFNQLDLLRMDYINQEG